jgi:dTDP-4-amino-4,6-dideoxygalactose transaminase
MSDIGLRVSRSIVGAAEAAAVSRVITEDGYLGMGAAVQQFEAELGEFLGVPPTSVVCVNSGTAAVHLSVQAAVERGAEVLVPSLTFVASFQAIAAANAVPVACDVRAGTATLDLADAARRLTSRTRAVMPVHYASYPADLDAVYAFAREHGLRVIEDAAHAFGCRHGGKLIGSFGDIACFSFDGIKNITSGEGGAIVSRDKAVLDRVRDARLLGVEHDTERRFSGERSWEFDVSAQGYRYHMSNLCAAIGSVQLGRLAGEFAPKRQALARAYRARLIAMPLVTLFETDPAAVVPHILPVRIGGGQRDHARKQLLAHGIQTGIHYKPNHLLQFFGGGAVSLPCAELLYHELLSLPLHPGMELQDVEHVVDTLASVLQNSPR